MTNTSKARPETGSTRKSPKHQAKNPILGIGHTGKIPIELLKFDKHNPRLSTGNDYSVTDDISIISIYREIAALDELVLSICSNNYLDLEPLIVIGPDSGPFQVLEGNRRLAAIMVIKDVDLARRCKISVPQPVRTSVLESIKLILARRVEKIIDAEPYIRFKHIIGPYRWDAYIKARFVANWYKRERDNGIDIDQIARQIGDTNNTIRAYIASIFVLDQAEQENIFSISDRFNKGRFAFSHLYTALCRKEYQDYLGLEKGWNQNLSDCPIADGYISKLGQVLKLIYGSKNDGKAGLVASQNPDLANLGKCLANTSATSRLLAGDSLEKALAEIEGSRLFNETLIVASAKLSKVIDLLPRYEGDQSLLGTADEIYARADMIKSFMEKTAHKKNMK
ncbi:MAG: hypothetical protein WCI11_10950 [Candidatus Methylumidiphilus sp.]